MSIEAVLNRHEMRCSFVYLTELSQFHRVYIACGWMIVNTLLGSILKWWWPLGGGDPNISF
jgi:hypothetical protein